MRFGFGAVVAVVVLFSTVCRPQHACACDICAVYTGTELQESRSGLRVGIAEQFTHAATLQNDGEDTDNPADEWLDSSITQLLIGYGVHPRVFLQANVPIIYRSFQRAHGTGTERSSESGVGDLSLHAIGTAYSHVSENSLQRVSVSVGVKLPTGSPSRLREELGGDAHADDPNIPPVFRSHRFWPRHTMSGPPSGIHGHDLALGTGSTDVILGAQWIGTYRRLYGTAMLQYFVRTEGSFDYTYANETIVSGGPGVFVWLSHASTLGVQSLLTVDTKGTDVMHGERLGDTGMTILYAGPAVHWTWKTNLSADVAIDVPAIRNNTALQIMPDIRVRTGFVWRF